MTPSRRAILAASGALIGLGAAVPGLAQQDEQAERALELFAQRERDRSLYGALDQRIVPPAALDMRALDREVRRIWLWVHDPERPPAALRCPPAPFCDAPYLLRPALPAHCPPYLRCR